ncbi:hypothetical protein F7Q99_04310 [Streptomyces kaniharaensis]|uniref:Uncharacterized protein n=1 Tax=Streptomyces kaniharaensis TaxID=212423 RepID=A0A6N7KME3_9ACTN|nr:hypothetical protein [Streptomyces kaniharaensis]MQS11527.1 hypothetical protein [Streptomyces kaniharaensis]
MPAHTDHWRGRLVETAVGTTAEQQKPAGRARSGHARTAPWHWALTLAGCGAVVGTALAATPATGTPVPLHDTPRSTPAAAAPDPARAQLPLNCGPFPVKATLSLTADLGDGRAGTVVAAHCAAENGTPPDAVYLLGGPADHPVVVATLLSERDNLTVSRLTLRSDGTITGHAQGYSSDDVPRFRPDVSLDLTWTRRGGSWNRAQTTAPITAT